MRYEIGWSGNMPSAWNSATSGFDHTVLEEQERTQVDLLGPTLKTHWYQAETGYDLTHFSGEIGSENFNFMVHIQ